MSSPRNTSDRVSTIAVTGVAFTLLALHLYDRLSTDTIDAADASVLTIPEWRELAREGLWLGPPDAPIVITEFVDFQCPYCAIQGPKIAEMLATTSDIAVVLHHFPLRTHPQAVPAAVAVECAHRQGKTLELVNLLYQKQDSIGVKSWMSYAEEASMPSISDFEQCASLPAESFSRISRGREIGGRFGIRGTPTFWVNERQVSSLRLDSEIQSIRER